MTLCLDVIGIICEFVKELSVLTVCTRVSKSVQNIILERILPSRKIRTLKISKTIYYPQRILSKIPSCYFVCIKGLTPEKFYYIKQLITINSVKINSELKSSFLCNCYNIESINENTIYEITLQLLKTIEIRITRIKGKIYLSIYHHNPVNYSPLRGFRPVVFNSETELFNHLKFKLNIPNLANFL